MRCFPACSEKPRESRQRAASYLSIASPREIVPRAFDSKQLRRRRNQAQGSLYFIDRSERIAATGNEQSGRAQLGKMRGAQLLGFFGRMQRIREQEQPIRDSRIFRRQHASLTAAIRMATEERAPRHNAPQYLDGAFQSGAVERSISCRRPMRASLAKGQITPQNRKAGTGECFGDRHQQRRTAIRSRAMRQHQGATCLHIRPVEKAAHRRMARRLVREPLDRGHTAYIAIILDASRRNGYRSLTGATARGSESRAWSG